MQQHEERVLTEKSELDEKLKKLETFMCGEIYAALPREERDLLSTQFHHMSAYSTILTKRIAGF
jgi:uncharacterized protein